MCHPLRSWCATRRSPRPPAMHIGSTTPPRVCIQSEHTQKTLVAADLDDVTIVASCPREVLLCLQLLQRQRDPRGSQVSCPKSSY
ncbi:hypothetical protein EON65_54395 [archaeon]|nr:MAG: hypothetical protein EON65_54395 [archaeon]